MPRQAERKVAPTPSRCASFPTEARGACRVLGRPDPAFDLALLKIPAVAPPRAMAGRRSLPVGSLLAAAGQDDLWWSVVQRGSAQPGRAIRHQIPPRRVPAEAPPGHPGVAVRGRGYWVEHVAGRLTGRRQPGGCSRPDRRNADPRPTRPDRLRSLAYVDSQQVPVKGATQR
jgi:hypothetical protein